MDTQYGYDLFYKMVEYVPLDQVPNACKANPLMKRVLCDNPNFWEERIEKDYGIERFHFEALGIDPNAPVALKYLEYLKKHKAYVHGKIQFMKKHIYEVAPIGFLNSATYWEDVIQSINFLYSTPPRLIFRILPDSETVNTVKRFYINVLLNCQTIPQNVGLAVYAIVSISNLNITVSIKFIMNTNIAENHVSRLMQILGSLCNVIDEGTFATYNTTGDPLNDFNVDRINNIIAHLEMKDNLEKAYYYQAVIVGAVKSGVDTEKYPTFNVEKAYDNLLALPDELLSLADNNDNNSSVTMVRLDNILRWLLNFAFNEAKQLFTPFAAKAINRFPELAEHVWNLIIKLIGQSNPVNLTVPYVRLLIDFISNSDIPPIRDLTFMETLQYNIFGMGMDNTITNVDQHQKLLLEGELNQVLRDYKERHQQYQQNNPTPHPPLQPPFYAGGYGENIPLQPMLDQDLVEGQIDDDPFLFE